MPCSYPWNSKSSASLYQMHVFAKAQEDNFFRFWDRHIASPKPVSPAVAWTDALTFRSAMQDPTSHTLKTQTRPGPGTQECRIQLNRQLLGCAAMPVSQRQGVGGW